MARVLVSRLVSALVAVLGASLVSFILLRALPSDPARLIAGPLASEEAVQEQYRRLGLDRPLHEQYVRYIADFLEGDWGFSYLAGASVRQLFAQRLAASAELALFAFILACVAAISLGLGSTYLRGRFDGVVRAVATLAMGTPPFWFGLLALLVFFEYLDVAPGPVGRLESAPVPPPVTGFFTLDAILAGQWNTFVEALRHIMLPAAALALAPFSYLVRLFRANILDKSRSHFVTVARSKGISAWRAHLRHVTPNAALPTLTASGLILAQLLGGSVLIEKVFNWPGLGTLVVNAILRHDYAVVQAFILLSAVVYVMVSMAIDVLYGVLDPRQRTG